MNELSAMRSRRDESEQRLQGLKLRLRQRAERDTRCEPSLPESFGRHASDWTKRHERFFQERLAILTSKSRNEIGAIERKLVRQNSAIRAKILA
jgi:hypothetical protein